MKTYVKYLAMVSFALSIFACGGNKNSSDKDKQTKDSTAAADSAKKPYSETKNGIKVSEAPNSPEYPDAKLELLKPKTDTVLKTGMTKFLFHVENYKLGMQTDDAGMKNCANSKKGQHIHYILDNTPYIASYDSVMEQLVPNGKHLLLAFLSRSYHESIKNVNAYVLKQLTAGPKTDTIKDYDLNAPYLFYSRPKGDYTGPEETQKILLDFYLVNTTISPSGNKVKATINGSEFILTKWVPYIIEGLPIGDNHIKLELIDKDGKSVTGIFNDSGDRKFVLKVK